MLRIVARVVLGVICVSVVSCGGAAFTPPPIGNDPAPVVNLSPDHQSNDIDAAFYGTPETIANSIPDAPLGTNPAYHVTELASATEWVSTLRGSSSISNGDPFVVDAVAVTDTSVQAADVNFSATGTALPEGGHARLWVKYETISAAISFTRTWSVSAPVNFTLTEPSVSSTTGGIHVASVDIALPQISGGNKSATLTVQLSGTKTASLVVVVVPVDSTKSTQFTIVDQPDVQGSTWQLNWEKMRTHTDWDFNDMVARINAREVLDANGQLTEVYFRIKPLARGEGYSASWQWNLESDFPGTGITTTTQIIRQGQSSGKLIVWRSQDGISVPVFHPGMNILPSPPGGGSTVNVNPGERYSSGGYVDVHVLLDHPLAPGSYTPLPARHHMLVDSGVGSAYMVGIRYGTGANKPDNSGRPTGFIVPAQFAWPLQGRDIKYAYPRFDTWAAWYNGGGAGPEPKWWLDTPVKLTGTTKNCYAPEFFVGGPSIPVPD